MTRRKLSRNSRCPCGSGKKYKHCCWGKDFAWTEDEEGKVIREVPLSAEAVALLEARRQQFRERFGRYPGPDELLFFEDPPLEQVEHHIVEAMKHAGIDPALIYAFEQTGLLVTEENEPLISEHDLRVWHEAVARYNAEHDRP
jgi:hypothetical protein